MAKPNFAFQKRQKELEKKKRNEEKLQRKLEKKNSPAEDDPELHQTGEEIVSS